MRHYEIVMLIHPDQSDQVQAMRERYQESILSQDGIIHRNEDCGRRQLAYPIRKSHKAHYLLMNIECSKAVIEQLDHLFRFNDAIIRYLILQVSEAITEPSPLTRKERPEGRGPESEESELSRGRD